MFEYVGEMLISLCPDHLVRNGNMVTGLLRDELVLVGSV